MRLAARGILVVLIVDAVLLAVLELLFLPLWMGGVPFPVTILLAAVSTPWLVRSAAELGGSPRMAGVPLIAWVIAILVFGIAGPGGDVLLTANWRSVLLLGAGIFPAAITLGRVLGEADTPRS